MHPARIITLLSCVFAVAVPFPSLAEDDEDSMIAQLRARAEAPADPPVGLQLRLGQIASQKRNLALGLGFKLLLAPLAICLLYVYLLGARGEAIQVTLFEAAMPPMITASIIASEHDLDPPLAALMVAVGLLLSFATLTGWWLVLPRLVGAA